VTHCRVCGTQQAESIEMCQRCGAKLAVSPTVSISPDELAQGDRRTAESPVFAHNATLAFNFAPGSMVADRYRVASLLGRGGMGEVYGADDLKLGQHVALKFLPMDRGKSTSWRDQFYAEVRMARQVSHPNVCRVYDVGESDGKLFLSMEFVDGEDLASLLRRIGRLPDDKAVEIAQQLCAGLAAAHRSGVLHRDLKPSNVMIDGKGRARITDFGLAIATSEANQQTSPAGTPGYLAPELLDGAAPSIQSDLYALGLVLYELFTGKKAFDASSLAEFHRKQTETNPTPPSSVVKNFDPAVERAILRCLDRDPAQRPRSALSVAASLPGGDPLASALAAGETPSPEMVAAAGPQGSLRPAVAWACLLGALILIFGESMLLAPRNMDWGLAPMNKSPEVLADRAQDLAQKLGYSVAVDRAFWVASDKDYLRYAARNSSSKDWKRTPTGHAWPSPVSFWYRQSPQWMMPGAQSPNGPPRVTLLNPSYETSGMVALRLDMQGNLLFLRCVPPQVETGERSRDLDWGLLFAEAGLDKTQFVPTSPKWAPPDSFDVRADWEGHLPDRPDLLLHVTAAAYHGVPVYFQLIAPWDQPWRGDPSSQSRMPAASDIFTMAWPVLMAGYLLVAGFFARRNVRRGRGDAKGALRLASFAILANCVYGFFVYHYVPQAEYISVQFILLGAPLLFALLAWLGYMAVEPYARQSWPKLMVSWQRLLNGRLRDPLVGRDVLLGIVAGSAMGTIFLGVGALSHNSAASPVDGYFGQGILPSIGHCFLLLFAASFYALFYFALLSVMTGLFRRPRLGLVAIALIMLLLNAQTTILGFTLTVLFVLVFLAVLVGIGLVAAASFFFIMLTLGTSPPLILDQWYAGRAMIALLAPLTLLFWGFYVSLGSQSVFGSALKEQ
jgi:predicted Ser/Thr protein kinase